VLYAAAILCINTIRTFFMIVLAILGPLVFGIAVFDGFQNSLVQWLTRYINIFLWLPIANIFGAIIGQVQQQMLKLDISQIQSAGDTFFSPNDTCYLVFLVIGIVGYFSVPTVANYVVHAHGGNGLMMRLTSIVANSGGQVLSKSVSAAGSVGGAAAERMGRGVGNLLNAPKHYWEGYHNAGSNYQKDKLSDKKS